MFGRTHYFNTGHTADYAYFLFQQLLLLLVRYLKRIGSKMAANLHQNKQVFERFTATGFGRFQSSQIFN